MVSKFICKCKLIFLRVNLLTIKLKYKTFIFVLVPPFCCHVSPVYYLCFLSNDAPQPMPLMQTIIIMTSSSAKFGKSMWYCLSVPILFNICSLLFSSFTNLSFYLSEVNLGILGMHPRHFITE